MAKIDSESAAEAIFEHKATLGHYEHKVFYVQEFVEKPGDIRVVAIDGEPIAAMVRSSDHWITNAAKGAEVDPFDVDDEARELVETASDAVGGGLLGVDLMETGVIRSTRSTTRSSSRLSTGPSRPILRGTVVDWLESKADAAADEELEVSA